MVKIKNYPFPVEKSILVSEKHYLNWPVVYMLDNHKHIYIGETNNLYYRMKQHFDNPEKRIFNRVHIIYDTDFNKSATLDIESALIKYIQADGVFSLTNKNEGLVNADYFQRDRYQDKITEIWMLLKAKKIVYKDLIEIENSDIFKFSPYKALSDDQKEIATVIRDDLLLKSKSNQKGIYFINGLPGSGKTVLATYLMKYLMQDTHLQNMRIALVVSMVSLRNTLKKVINNIEGLKKAMVIGPTELHKDIYDVIIVDEAHRLRQRKGIVSYKSFDNKNIEFGFGLDGTELDWIKSSSKHLILFYDENQMVRPSDVNKSEFDNLAYTYKFTLNSQFRVKAGMEFVNYIRNIFRNEQINREEFEGYDSSIVNDFSTFVNIIEDKNKEFGLSLIVSGYAFEWVSKTNKNRYDISIDNINLKWNTVTDNFIYSANAAKEVGCIHTVQGYELNYVGVIIGKDIDYNFKNQQIEIYPEHYFDRNGKVSTDYYQLKTYIQNIYITLSTRGIRGIYFYVMNENMKRYISQFFRVQ